MNKEMMDRIFFPYGISLLKKIGNNVYLIEHVEEPDEKQVLKVIDVAERAKEEANEKYSEEIVKRLFSIIHGNELIWNEKITLTQCEYLVRILEDYTISPKQEDVCLYAIRMPYYETLEALCEKKAVDENTVIDVGIHICNALRTLHHDGSKEYYQNDTVRFGAVLHLDIKPDNIFYEKTEKRKTFMLGDFGTVIEKGNRPIPMTTSGYFAPELRNSECIPTETADIFSLGMTLYRCFCNSEEEQKEFWESRFRGEDVKRPENCSVHLWNVIEHATKAVPEERYQSAAEMLDALLNINADKAVIAEIQKENAQKASTMMTAAALFEAGVFLNNIIGKVKSLPDKTERIELNQFGAFYEGGTRNGNPHGNGRCTYRYGSETKTICGSWEWVKNKKLKSGGTKIIYTGMLCGGKINGLGQIEIPKAGVYIGITNDEKFQIGTMQWKNGDSYAGLWEHQNGYECMHGEGTYRFADGTVQHGQWEYGNFIEESVSENKD